jgi:hypothetical protein
VAINFAADIERTQDGLLPRLALDLGHALRHDRGDDGLIQRLVIGVVDVEYNSARVCMRSSMFWVPPSRLMAA